MNHLAEYQFGLLPNALVVVDLLNLLNGCALLTLGEQLFQ